MIWEFDNNKPIYLQLLDILKFKIISGELPAGSKLNSVRDMAEEAGVNPNTMQKALAELERENLVYSQRTSGRFVTDDEEKIKSMREKIANIEIKSLSEILIKLGYEKNELVTVITKSLEEVK
jgi:DNA-binding transcriptional regulator YhcF (GntR family)